MWMCFALLLFSEYLKMYFDNLLNIKTAGSVLGSIPNVDSRCPPASNFPDQIKSNTIFLDRHIFEEIHFLNKPESTYKYFCILLILYSTIRSLHIYAKD